MELQRDREERPWYLSEKFNARKHVGFPWDPGNNEKEVH